MHATCYTKGILLGVQRFSSDLGMKDIGCEGFLTKEY